MRSWLDYADGAVEDPPPAIVEELVRAGTPCWLDVEDPTDEVMDRLATGLTLHPLAVEDSKQFGQRASLSIYGDVAMIVAFWLHQEFRELIEVHCYSTPPVADHASPRTEHCNERAAPDRCPAPLVSR